MAVQTTEQTTETQETTEETQTQETQTEETQTEEQGTEEASFLSGEETKPEDGKGTQAKAKDAATDVEVKFPEGFEVDDLLLNALKKVAKEKQLKAEEVNELASSIASSRDAFIQGIVEKDKAVKAGWVKELAADAEIGGVNLKESQAAASKVFKKFDPSGKLTKFLKESGLSNHPELSRVFVRIGKAMSEDRISGQNSNHKGREMDPEEKAMREMYPSMFEQQERV